MIKLGQVGVGKWGPNFLKTFAQIDGCEIKTVCDLDLQHLQKAKDAFPSLLTTDDFNILLNDNEIKAIIITTPTVSHFSLAKSSLLAGKDVFIEKPFVLNLSQAKELLDLAAQQKRKLMIGHLLLYHNAILKMKELIKDGKLGKIFFLYFRRGDLGRFKKEENVLWDLASHDIYLSFYLLDKFPLSVNCNARAYLQKDVVDLAFTILNFPDNITAHIHSSWLEPFKQRMVVVVGSEGMFVFDDLVEEGKLKFVRKKIKQTEEVLDHLRFQYINEGVENLPISNEEPLKTECQHFFDCLRNGKMPLSNGIQGLEVLKVLHAVEESAKNEDKMIYL